MGNFVFVTASGELVVLKEAHAHWFNRFDWVRMLEGSGLKYMGPL